MTSPESIAAALGVMLRRVHFAGPDDLPDLARAAGRELGAEDTVIYLVDYDQIVLVRLSAGEPVRRVLPVEGTVAGRLQRDRPDVGQRSRAADRVGPTTRRH